MIHKVTPELLSQILTKLPEEIAVLKETARNVADGRTKKVIKRHIRECQKAIVVWERLRDLEIQAEPIRAQLDILRPEMMLIEDTCQMRRDSLAFTPGFHEAISAAESKLGVQVQRGIPSPSS